MAILSTIAMQRVGQDRHLLMIANWQMNADTH
jgi:hypothetical protein